MIGFGHGSFGEDPFGRTDWAYQVLWEELPEYKKQEDLDTGGWFQKFVQCLAMPINELKFLIYKSHDYVLDPRTARADLLRYIAGNFGIIPDLDEPEEFQRTKIEIVGRWRLIKGTENAYKVLCAIHGFNVDVSHVWSSGTNNTTTGPHVSEEQIGVIG
jgi:hypothetical protein